MQDLISRRHDVSTNDVSKVDFVRRLPNDDNLKGNIRFKLCRGDGQVVSVLALFSDDPSSKPAEV